jgi:hypothetical protein
MTPLGIARRADLIKEAWLPEAVVAVEMAPVTQLSPNVSLYTNLNVSAAVMAPVALIVIV